MRELLSKIDRRYAKVCIYASATVLVTLGLGMVLWYSSGFFDALWKLFCSVAVPLVVGAGFSYLLNPAVGFVSHRLRDMGYRVEEGQRRRRAAVAITLAVVAIALLALLLLFALMITHSLSGVDPRVFQDILDSVQGDFNSLLSRIEEQMAALGLSTDALNMESLFGAVGGVTDFFSTALFSLIFCVYFLLDGPTIFDYLERVVSALFGERALVGLRSFLDDADRVFSGYIRGQAIDALVVGVLAAVSFTLIGVPFGAPVGLLTGLGNMIPYVGGPVGYVSVVLVCAAEGKLGTMVAGILALTVIMLVDANVINPKLLSQNVEIHPLLVVAALIAGSAVGGIVGMLTAVPIAAFIKVKVDAWLQRVEERRQE